MSCKATHYTGCECRERRLRLLTEKALQTLGAPVMSYAPSVAFKELEVIRTKVSKILYELRREFNA